MLTAGASGVWAARPRMRCHSVGALTGPGGAAAATVGHDPLVVEVVCQACEHLFDGAQQTGGVLACEQGLWGPQDEFDVVAVGDGQHHGAGQCGQFGAVRVAPSSARTPGTTAKPNSGKASGAESGDQAARGRVGGRSCAAAACSRARTVVSARRSGVNVR